MIPIRTDYRLNRIPWMNVAIIVANVAIFFLGFNGAAPLNRMRIDAWMLQPDNPQLEQFFSSVFLHANLAHLLGNMVFLWVFGNAVNDKFGHVGYAAFYLAGGVLAGVGYL
ncbi:MAG TPA: rhomboid family intramembrane serine protease, partial [Phycisphaerales bacterium]|nr:rhomboid family intramembrane serine protease [Phycisphaerales bacterium]